MISKVRVLTNVAAAAAFAAMLGTASVAVAQDAAANTATAVENTVDAAANDAAAMPADNMGMENEATNEAAAEPAKEGENPYGLKALWEQGDFVSRGTLIILSIMSAGTWYILFTKFFAQRRMFSHAKTAKAKFWNAGSIEAGTALLEKDSAFRAIAQDGLNATQHHEGGMTAAIDLHEWTTMELERSTESVNSFLGNGLSFLATVGSTAPFVGLFGTVWGIYHALISIGMSGNPSIDKVAGPVGEALIMTAFGLLVAVPAVLAYNWLLRRNKVAMEQVRAFSADLHALLISGKK